MVRNVVKPISIINCKVTPKMVFEINEIKITK